MLDPKFFSLLAALMQVTLRERPDLRDEILKLAEHYEATVFTQNAPVLSAFRDAIFHIVNG